MTIKDNGNLDIKLADSKDELIKAFSLTHNTYVQSGYMDPHPSGMRIITYNALPSTKVLIVRDNGNVTATITLIFDSPLGLPSDEIYPEEMDYLRREGRKIAEGSSFAAQKISRNKNHVMYLFKKIHTYLQYAGVDDICIMVHPRHAKFYEKILLFEPMGGVKYLPNLKNAPAVLERLDLRTWGEKLQKKTCGKLHRDLYTFFFDNGQGNPDGWLGENSGNGFYMSQEMLHYFFVEQTNIFRRIDENTMSYIKSCYPDW